MLMETSKDSPTGLCVRNGLGGDGLSVMPVPALVWVWVQVQACGWGWGWAWGGGMCIGLCAVHMCVCM